MSVWSHVLTFSLGVLSCWAFWSFLFLIKPKLSLPERLAYDPRSGRLRIKICNVGMRQATDVQLRLASYRHAPSGRMVRHGTGHVKDGHLLALDPNPRLEVPWCLPTTYVFVCQNGKELVDDVRAPTRDGEHRIVVTLSARDGISGTTVVQRQSYTADRIVDGRYGLGLAADIGESPLTAENEDPPPNHALHPTGAGAVVSSGG